LSTIDHGQAGCRGGARCSALDRCRHGKRCFVKARGFRLTLLGQDGKPFKILPEDKAVPGSRDCPTSYALSEAYKFTPSGKSAVIAILVQRFSQGFEGRDRCFIAVTGEPR